MFFRCPCGSALGGWPVIAQLPPCRMDPCELQGDKKYGFYIFFFGGDKKSQHHHHYCRFACFDFNNVWHTLNILVHVTLGSTTRYPIYLKKTNIYCVLIKIFFLNYQKYILLMFSSVHKSKDKCFMFMPNKR